ncbi:hypothetical protein SISSUDRAFT_1053275 [Sistotremastrum suecicum HHB10207 ss-3]|uniref:Xylanolytic transcriptional activator regulatory domain-containing protein n=1 Tax=Sistotremastrum suecicum HHB10207 ss-3 TaxID=1314776 RepID=A0A165ZBZ4_9AGAM|nr:hypothetical protein SISSUDRAFT_1053275 [Sistotremastrum suecicum HHB10207 ss-3]
MSTVNGTSPPSDSSEENSMPTGGHSSLTHGTNSADSSGRNSPASHLWPFGEEQAAQRNITAPFLRHLGPTAPVPGYQRVDVPSRSRSDSIHSTTSHASSPYSSSSGSPVLSTSSLSSSYNPANSPVIHSTSSFPFNLNPPMSPNLLSPSHLAELFDPDRPRYPAPHLMDHLVELFFTHLGCHFPFLDHDSIVERVKSGTLPAILANGIAALSSRFSDRPELINNCLPYAAGEPFSHMAKLLVVPMMSWPSVEVLHALVLIAWAEYGSARDSGLFMYSRMAVAMLLDLGLGNAQTIQMAKKEEERDMLRFTWWSVARIDLTSSWVTGRPASLKETQFDITLPSSQKTSEAASKTLLFAYLTEMFTIRDEVTAMMNDESTSANKSPADIVVGGIQARLANFYRNLPSELEFTQENYQRFSQHRQGTVLLLLHLMFHGANVLVHWPSLFREFEVAVPHSIEVSYASSRAMVDAILIAHTIDPTGVLTNPFFDVPISVAARAFLAARTTMGAAVHKSALYREEWNEANLTTCMDVLCNMSKYWGGAAIVENLLEQRGAKPSAQESSQTDPFHPHSHSSSSSRDESRDILSRHRSNSVASSVSSSTSSRPTTSRSQSETTSPTIHRPTSITMPVRRHTGLTSPSTSSSTSMNSLITPMFDHDLLGNPAAVTPRPLQLPSQSPGLSASNSNSGSSYPFAMPDLFAAFFENQMMGTTLDPAQLEDLQPASSMHGMSAREAAGHGLGHSGLLSPGLENSLFSSPSWVSQML